MRWGLLALTLWIGSMLAVESAATLAPRVEPEAGVLRGERDRGVDVYRGIPYAAAPVGPLRWRPPAPAPQWRGVRDARHPGTACLQPALGLPEQSDEQQSEDCLYLNVWTPSRAGAKRPVMVWIHGGALQVGSGSLKLYDGARLARRGVVVVTFNYRLGRFGYFAHRALAGEGARGNFGLLDQLAALRWVQRNIAAFGGDPGNVTIFGESAGGMSVQTLMTLPEARGLFAKAISESGGGNAVFPSLETAEQIADAWSASLGLSAPDAAQLRALPAEKIVGATGLTGMIIDGTVLKHSPGEAFALGLQAPVPFLIGGTSYEASLAILTEQRARQSLGARYDELLAAFEQRVGNRASATLRSELYVQAPARFLARQQAAKNPATYLYRFDYLPHAARSRLPGVPHMGELPFVFGNFGVFDLVGETEADRPMAELVARLWTNFARTGRPDDAAGPSWPAVRSDAVTTLLFGPDRVQAIANDAFDDSMEAIAMQSPRKTDADLRRRDP